MQGCPGSDPPVPRWLRFVLRSDRAGSSWFIGTGFFFAPVLALISPWPQLTAVVWLVVGLAGLWLGLLGIAMATGLTIVLRSNAEIPEEYWRSVLDYRTSQTSASATPPTSGAHSQDSART